jgi:DNA-binding transcriptional LysR family regulator
MKRADPLAGVSTFLAVAELQSFAAAARRLGISAATVSTQIAELELRLAVRLIHRSTRHVTLTAAGEAYQSAMNGLLDQAQRANDIAGAFRGELSGTLRITAPIGSERLFLKPAIDRFMAEHPAISIDLYFTAASVNLVEGGYDLAIRGTHGTDANWITRKIVECRVHVAASPAYLARRGTPLTPADLSDHDTVHFSNLSFGKFWLLRRDERAERVAINARLQSNDGHALRQWALDGHGLALLPDFLIGDDLAAGRLVELLDGWQPPSFDMNAVYPDNKHITAKVRLFVDTLIDTHRA